MTDSLKALFSLSGTRVCVTGAAGQLGRGLVTTLVACGADVVAADADPRVLEASAQELGWNPERVLLMKADIRESADIARCFAEGAERFGGVNALVNNAGVSVFEPFLERPEASIDWVMDVNLKGTLLCTKAFIQHRMDHGEGGAIVNIASHYGLISPDPRIYTDCDRKNSEIYGATKAGILQMTRYYAVHAMSYGIRVNAVSPGGVRNPESPQGQDFQKEYGFRCPMGRMAETREVMGAVVFLLSPAASYVNGHNLVVDGGMTSW